MNGREAIAAVYCGGLVRCTKEEYEFEVRLALQTQAGKWIDWNDHIRAQIALQEVRRLDDLYGPIDI